MSDVSASKRRRVEPEVTEDGTLELPIKFNRCTGGEGHTRGAGEGGGMAGGGAWRGGRGV